MRRGTVIEIVAAVLCFAAAVISYNLVLKHVTGSSGAAWFEAGCSDKPAAGGANCAAVLASPYSYFPPRMSAEADGRAHWPVAFLGLVYYSTLLTWLIGVGRPSARRRRLHILPLLLVGMGLAASAYYLNIMFRVLDEWCSWCVATHVLNLLIAICLVLMWPRRMKPATSVAAGGAPSTHEQSSTAAAHSFGPRCVGYARSDRRDRIRGIEHAGPQDLETSGSLGDGGLQDVPRGREPHQGRLRRTGSQLASRDEA